MEVVNVASLLDLNVKKAVAIGFFDSVHLGHQQVIKTAVTYAKEFSQKSVVITFDKSPKEALGFTKDTRYITPTLEKLHILKEMGVDYILILKLNQSFLQLSADEFILKYLQKINASFVSVGFDFRFGAGGARGADYLVGSGLFKVNVTKVIELAGAKVSTTRIKKCMKKGDLSEINLLIGRPYSISGIVTYGNQLGKEIGFPTANLKLGADYMMNLQGVFATACYIDDQRYVSMTNVGYNPTINLVDDISIETHIFDFDGDIYDKWLRLEFIKKIRDEMKFADVEELIKQLKKDKSAVKKVSI